MTIKERIVQAVNSLPEDTSYTDAIERLNLLRKIEIGLQQADQGDVISHEEFMKELFSEEEYEE